MLRSFFRVRSEFRSMANTMKMQLKFMLDNSFGSNYPQLALAGTGPMPKMAEDQSTESVFDNWVWFAAPKSKISPSRKRQKHMKFFPEKVAWVKCEKCGDPKRLHRICTDHIDICAMRPEEYGEFLKKKMAEEAKNN